MGVPTSEVGYIAAMPRREEHEVHKDMWWHWTKKKYLQDYAESNILLMDTSHLINCNIILDTKLCSLFDYSEEQKGSSSLYSKDTESNLG